MNNLNASNIVSDNSDCIGDDHKKFNHLANNCVFNAIKSFYVNNFKQFKIAHININSIRHKFHVFKEVLESNIFDVLTIQESKLDESFPENQFHVSRYKMYRKDFKGNEGGILLYIRNDMAQMRRLDIEQAAFQNENGRIEIICVEVTVNKEKWIILSMYKQPKVKTTLLVDCIDQIMSQCVHLDVNFILIGDLNVNMLSPNNLSDCFDTYGLKNIVKDPTCFKGNPSLIDLIVTNRSKRFKSTVSVDTGMSDFHSLVCTSTKLHVSKLQSNTFKYRSYKHFDNDKYVQDISCIPYIVTEVFDDPDDCYWAWNKLTMEVIDEHAPLKTKRVKGFRVPYMNGKLRRAINVRNMLKRKHEKTKSKENWYKYVNQRNLVT